MSMNIILEAILGLGVAIVIFIGAFVAGMQATTLWAGKKITPRGMDNELPRGFQDAITPKIQDTFNTILPISYIAILISGSIIAWYLGIASLIVAFIGMSIVKAFMPKRIKFYLKIINYYMMNKTADYAKAGDSMRAEASKDVTDKLTNLYLTIADDLEVPDFSSIKAMPVGD